MKMWKKMFWSVIIFQLKVSACLHLLNLASGPFAYYVSFWNSSAMELQILQKEKAENKNWIFQRDFKNSGRSSFGTTPEEQSNWGDWERESEREKNFYIRHAIIFMSSVTIWFWLLFSNTITSDNHHEKYFSQIFTSLPTLYRKRAGCCGEMV